MSRDSLVTVRVPGPLRSRCRGASELSVRAGTVQGVLDADFAVVQGFVLVSAIISLVVYLIVDLVYLAIDPRLTH